jgi:hypothetical protein
LPTFWNRPASNIYSERGEWGEGAYVLFLARNSAEQ